MSRENRSMRSAVCKALCHAGVFAVPVENSVYPGTPDVAVPRGWIELKRLDSWPARYGTIVRVETWTAVQRSWHRRWAAAGGSSWVVLCAQAEHEWIVLPGLAAVEALGHVDRDGLRDASALLWRGAFHAAVREVARLVS